MSLVLIIEDEAMLRQSMSRGIGRMDGIEVMDAEGVDAALALIDRRRPDLIVSDIDMPDRPGVELLGELGRRRIDAPIIFVSAYLKAYGAQMPPHANIEMLEKPVALDEIRKLIRKKLDEAEVGLRPFGAPELLQLASWSRRSLVVEARWPDGASGRILVHEGEAWHAEAGELRGTEAFVRVAWDEEAAVSCHPLEGPPAERSLKGSPELLLMELAPLLDDSGHAEPAAEEASPKSSAAPSDAAPSDSDPAPEESPPKSSAAPSDAAPSDGFERLVEAGIEALLVKDYHSAVDAFSAAEATRPGDSIVNTNLRRLQEMGYGTSQAGEDT